MPTSAGLVRACNRCKKPMPAERKSPRCTACKRYYEIRDKKRLGLKEFRSRKAKQARVDYVRHADTRRSSRRAQRANLRQELIEAYGSKCSCCGEKELAFLTLEHVNRDGKAHRESLSNGKYNSWSEAVYRDLKLRGWPKEGYTLLCFNCNHASWKLGVCPHQKEKKNA